MRRVARPEACTKSAASAFARTCAACASAHVSCARARASSACGAEGQTRLRTESKNYPLLRWEFHYVYSYVVSNARRYVLDYSVHEYLVSNALLSTANS